MADAATAPRLGKKERTRREIYRTAMQLFGEHGYDGVTIEDICAGAGIAKATFFLHFRNKAALLLAFNEEITTALAEKLSQNDGSSADGGRGNTSEAGPSEPLEAIAAPTRSRDTISGWGRRSGAQQSIAADERESWAQLGEGGEEVCVEVTSVVRRRLGLTSELEREIEALHELQLSSIGLDELGGQEYGVGSLVHGLLDVIVDGHFDAVQALDDGIESLEDDLFDGSARADLQRRTFQLRKDLVALRRVVLPMREVVTVIQHRRMDAKTAPELDPVYADLYDHVLRASEWTESLRDMVTTVFETNLSMQDARLNVVMKKLTGWAAIIAVPTAITGFYGQNVAYPGIDTVGGFVTSSAAIVLLVIVLFVMFRKRDWL